MQAGINQLGKLYIKFAMNFAIPLSKGGTDVFCPTKASMLNMADSFIGKPFTIGIGGPVIGKIIDRENPVPGHFIFEVLVDDEHKDTVLKILQHNRPELSMGALTTGKEQTIPRAKS